MRYLGKEFLLNINLDNYYCIDMEDLDIGGSYNDEFINYVRLDLNLCENDIKYDENNTKCTPYEKFEEMHGKDNAWFFEILYPKVHFQPIRKGIPFLISYQTYYYIFSKFSNKVDRIYFQEYIIEDDKGWIFNIAHNISYWGTYSISGDNYFRGDNDILKYGSNSRLYSLKIYLNLGITFYTRKYKKLYEIFSEIFIVVKVIISLFTYLSEEINDIHSSKKLNGLLMKIEYNYRNIKNLIKPKFDNELKTKTFVHHNFDRNSVISDLNAASALSKRRKTKIKKPNGLDDSSNIYLTDILNNSMYSKQFQLSGQRSLGSNYEKEQIKYPLIYYIKMNFLMKFKLFKKNNKYLPHNFLKNFNMYRQLIDISSYITLYKQFEIIKKIVLNQNSSSNEQNNQKKEDVIILNKNKGKKF